MSGPPDECANTAHARMIACFQRSGGGSRLPRIKDALPRETPFTSRKTPRDFDDYGFCSFDFHFYSPMPPAMP